MKNDLGKRIDEIGVLRARIKELEVELKPLEDEIKKAELSFGIHFGEDYQLKISERADTPLIAEKVLKIVGEKKFMSIVKVVKTLAAKYMSLEDITKASGEPVVTKVYSYSEKEG